MNDRFKFRVWDSEAGQFFEDHTIDALKLHLRPDGALGFISGKTCIDAFTICQCTGLKDRNDRLIFEGDILEREHDETLRFKIIWELDGFIGVRIKKENHFVRVPNFHSRGEVIGNIYENPELLS